MISSYAEVLPFTPDRDEAELSVIVAEIGQIWYGWLNDPTGMPQILACMISTMDVESLLPQVLPGAYRRRILHAT